jgi:8-oxo-dGTP pyrophosphatase MutT (NUDIX family)
MYKIFINEKPFIITQNDVQEKRFVICKRVQYNHVKISETIKECEGLQSTGVVVLSDDPEYVFTEFKKHFVAIEAAGGIVFNNKNEILLIKRMGKWDLPKGKIEGEESDEHAAIREVEEECGIGELQIETKLSDTFHTYKMHNHRFLKITHWFKMHTTDTKKLIPQLEEQITEAAWFDWGKIDVNELDTYFSIRELLLDLKI